MWLFFAFGCKGTLSLLLFLNRKLFSGEGVLKSLQYCCRESEVLVVESIIFLAGDKQMERGHNEPNKTCIPALNNAVSKKLISQLQG